MKCVQGSNRIHPAEAPASGLPTLPTMARVGSAAPNPLDRSPLLPLDRRSQLDGASQSSASPIGSSAPAAPEGSFDAPLPQPEEALVNIASSAWSSPGDKTKQSSSQVDPMREEIQEKASGVIETKEPHLEGEQSGDNAAQNGQKLDTNSKLLAGIPIGTAALVASFVSCSSNVGLTSYCYSPLIY